MRPDTDRPNTLKGLSSYPSLAFTVPACRGFVHIFRPHFQPGGLQAGVKSESVLVSRGCSQLASTRAALSSPPPAAFRPAVSHTAILAGAPSPGPTSFPLPCRRVLSRSQRLAACRARYLWGTSTGEGLWYSGPWPVFPAFPGVREVILLC